MLLNPISNSKISPMKLFILFSIFISLFSCQSLNSGAPSLSSEESAILMRALNYVKEKNLKKATDLYDILIKNTDNETLKPLILFNAGSVYREMGDCNTSIHRYRQLLKSTFNEKKFRARALLEMSYSYDCVGKTKLGFLSLKDLGFVRQNLSIPFNLAVYPARLGIAYSHIGKPLRAEQYRSLALNGILQLKTRYTSEQKLNEELSSLFYIMGRSYMNPKNMNAKEFLRAFPHHHLYLWQALFIQHFKWEPLAEKELLSLYEKLKTSLKSKKISAFDRENTKQSFKDIEILINKEKNSRLKKFFNKNKVL